MSTAKNQALRSQHCIIKNCAHEEKHTGIPRLWISQRNSRSTPHPLHHRALRSPRRQSRDGRGRSGHAWRIGHQAWGEEDSPALSGQDSGRICRFDRRRVYAVQPLRGEAGAVPRQCWARSAVELAKDWRTDKFLRHLEALLLVADKEQTFLLSGQGDVIEPDSGIAAIGSGGLMRKRPRRRWPITRSSRRAKLLKKR